MSLFTKTTTIKLDIEGMTCANCAKHVTEALLSVDGVKKANVDDIGHSAMVEAKEDTDVDRLIAAVEEAGYGAKPQE